MIEDKGEVYRATIVDVLGMFSLEYKTNDRAQYIVNFLKEELDTSHTHSHADGEEHSDSFELVAV
jgi:hypothetical protein